jgi:hypothetical protein
LCRCVDTKIELDKNKRSNQNRCRKWSQERIVPIEGLRQQILAELPKDLRRQLEVLLDACEDEEMEQAVLTSLNG